MKPKIAMFANLRISQPRVLGSLRKMFKNDLLKDLQFEAMLVDLQRPDLRLQSGSCFLRPVDIFAGENPAEAAGVASLPLSQESLCKTPSRYFLFQESLAEMR